MNVLIILKTIFLYIKNLFYLKGFGTDCATYVSNANIIITNVIFGWTIWAKSLALRRLTFYDFIIYWTLDVSEITLVRLSVCPSVCSSFRLFLKIGSLVFSDTVHDDS